MPRVLEVESLSKQYADGTWANRDISLSVSPGEFLAVLGPNGAGKTTLVRQITTELIPTSGIVRILGHDAQSDQVRVKTQLGVMPQEARLFHSLSVWHHLRTFGKLRGLSPSQARLRAEELLTALRLTEHRDKPSQSLSGGLRRRVLLGLAMLTSPPLMVLDEPTTGLDPQSRLDLWQFIRQHKQRGMSIVLTTHYMDEAEALCDRVAIIRRGQLIALDSVKNLRFSHGLEYKLTFERQDARGRREVIYGESDGPLIDRARDLGLTEFTVARANLEDVYLALTGETEGLDERG